MSSNSLCWLLGHQRMHLDHSWLRTWTTALSKAPKSLNFEPQSPETTQVDGDYQTGIAWFRFRWMHQLWSGWNCFLHLIDSAPAFPAGQHGIHYWIDTWSLLESQYLSALLCRDFWAIQLDLEYLAPHSLSVWYGWCRWASKSCSGRALLQIALGTGYMAQFLAACLPDTRS